MIATFFSSTTPTRRRSRWAFAWPALGLMLLVPLPAPAAQLVAVRVGEYDTFTRVVFELDEATGYRVQRDEGSDVVQVTLAAGSRNGSVSTNSARLGGIALRQAKGTSQARLELSDAGLRIEEMVLRDPPRLVVDAVSQDDPSTAAGRAGTPPAWVESTQIASAADVPPPAAGRSHGPRSSAVSSADPTPAPIVVADVTDDDTTVVIGGGTAAAPAASGEPVFRVSRFEILYADPHPELPPSEEIGAATAELGAVADGYVAPGAGGSPTTVTLSDTFPAQSDRFRASAILAVNQAIVNALNARGYVAVLAQPDEQDIHPRTGADLRPGGRTVLRLVVYVGRVKDMRTFASGQRVGQDQESRTNNPVHRPILERSPVQPDGVHDLIRKDEIDDYTARLNRHPGRRVDAIISPAREPGGAYLDYMVAELKPWFVYGGASNTGTETTTTWREQFGFTHTQLSNHDDILNLSYVTGNFSSQLNAVALSYDTPLWFVHPWAREHVRVRPFGNWLMYDSSVLGFSGTPFEGWSAWGGMDVPVNVFQYETFFVDVYAGLRYAHSKVENQLVIDPLTGGPSEGETDFFLPRAGLHFQRLGDWNAFYANFDFEGNVASVAGTEQSQIDRFGRGNDVAKNWWLMRWQAEAYTYLEPLIFPEGFKDPSTPFTSTTAHELWAQCKGQVSFGDRLIPQEMHVAGGLYTVRGYKEAVVAGDTAVIGRVEYRLHIPRLFRPVKEPLEVPYAGPFRWAPQQVYGQPDWDLIFRVFLDVGWVKRVDPQPFEIGFPETLVGSGAGLELLVRRNLSVRFDYGWILDTLASVPSQEVGDSRANVAIRILY